MEALQAKRAALLAADAALEALPELTFEERQVDSVLQRLKQQFSSTYSTDQLNEYWGIIRQVKNTELYKFLYAMPKGTLQHCHDAATLDFEKYFAVACEFPDV